MISPDGKRMYLSPMGAPKKVTIVDVLAGYKVIGEIPFANSVRPPAMSRTKLFFQNRRPPWLSVSTSAAQSDQDGSETDEDKRM